MLSTFRSSSDDTGAVKEYETTTISKLTNEVTTISRVVGKDHIATEDHSGGRETVSYTNNVIKIHSNVEIRKDQATSDVVKPVALVEVFADSVIKDTSVVTKDVMFTDSNKLEVPDKMPMMSQKSIDFVVDSLTNGACSETIDLDKEKESLMMLKKNLAKKPDDNSDGRPRTVIKLNEVLKASNELRKQKTVTATQSKDECDDYEVIIKLPNRKTIRMKAVEEEDEFDDKRQIKMETKERLKQALFNKTEKVHVKPLNQIPVIKRIHSVENDRVVPNIVTLYPVTLVNASQPVLLTNTLQKVPIPAEFPFKGPAKSTPYSKKEAVKRAPYSKSQEKTSKISKTAANSETRSMEEVQDWEISNVRTSTEPADSELTEESRKTIGEKSTFAKHFLERRSAASRRYR